MNPETSSNQPQKRQIKLQIPPDLNAIYCNMAILSSTKNEMIRTTHHHRRQRQVLLLGLTQDRTK